MINRIRAAAVAACLFLLLGAVVSVKAQMGNIAKAANPELIGLLTKGLSVTPQQAAGGSGALFGYAKNQLAPTDFKKIADVVPGMSGLLKAAPKSTASTGKGATDVLSSATGGGTTDIMSSVGSMIPGKAGGIASLAGSFGSLGLSPDMIGKFVPVLSQYVKTKGGSEVANILTGVLK